MTEPLTPEDFDPLIKDAEARADWQGVISLIQAKWELLQAEKRSTESAVPDYTAEIAAAQERGDASTVIALTNRQFGVSK